MQIIFSDEAGETFQRLASQLASYTVRIEVEDAPNEVFDAILIGTDPDSEWVDALRVNLLDSDGDDSGDTISVRVRSLLVY